jgi:anti-sigma factor ChrR (cupin superfamily)
MELAAMLGPAPTVDSGTCIERVASGNAYASASVAEWTLAKDGIWCKRLYNDPIRGESTLLMRLDSGAASSAHSHENFEQIHVISGSFHDGERLMQAGDHCCRAPGAMHTSASDDGALVLVMYTPA